MIRVSRGMSRRRRPVERMCTTCNARGVRKSRIWNRGCEIAPTNLVKDLDDQVGKVWEGEENEDKGEGWQKSVARTNSSSPFSLLLQNLCTTFHNLRTNSLIRVGELQTRQGIILNELYILYLQYFSHVPKIPLLVILTTNLIVTSSSPLPHPCCGGVAWEATKLLQPIIVWKSWLNMLIQYLLSKSIIHNLRSEDGQKMSNHVLVDEIVPERSSPENLHLTHFCWIHRAVC